VRVGVGLRGARTIPTLESVMVDGSTVAMRSMELRSGYRDGRRGVPLGLDYREAIADIRARFGFARVAADLLTPPLANLKLAKSGAAYGLTLSSHVSDLGAVGLGKVNACPRAGQCVAVCVLHNGMGRYASVQRARLWRTAFVAAHPVDAAYVIGWELGRAVRRYEREAPSWAGNRGILFRANVNSDIRWGAVFGAGLRELDGVTSYGYSKRTDVLEGIDSGLHVEAFSFSESSDWELVDAHLARGGNVAVVTNRRPHDGIVQWHGSVPVVDADLSDAWIVETVGTIGDLSAKGKARGLIGKRPRSFVQSVYGGAS